mgnify:CR=1 FL=1
MTKQFFKELFFKCVIPTLLVGFSWIFAIYIAGILLGLIN